MFFHEIWTQAFTVQTMLYLIGNSGNNLHFFPVPVDNWDILLIFLYNFLRLRLMSRLAYKSLIISLNILMILLNLGRRFFRQYCTYKYNLKKIIFYFGFLLPL